MESFFRAKYEIAKIYSSSDIKNSDFWIREEKPTLETIFNEMHRLKEQGIREIVIPITRWHFINYRGDFIPKSKADLNVIEREIDCSMKISW